MSFLLTLSSTFKYIFGCLKIIEDQNDENIFSNIFIIFKKNTWGNFVTWTEALGKQNYIGHINKVIGINQDYRI